MTTNITEQKPKLFHEFLAETINKSTIKQADMAEELGFEKPNIITMFKQGKTRVPLQKIPGLAKILGLDPKATLKMAMLEYAPELFRTIEATFGALVTANEKVILDEIRRISGNSDPAITSIAHKQALEEFVRKITGTH